MSVVNPFTPCFPSSSYVASATSGNVLIPASVGDQLIVSNAGAVVTFINLGGSTVAATAATSMALLPGITFALTISGDQTYLAAATSSSTATLYLTRGFGD